MTRRGTFGELRFVIEKEKRALPCAGEPFNISTSEAD